jgi:hypothetical protein
MADVKLCMYRLRVQERIYVTQRKGSEYSVLYVMFYSTVQMADNYMQATDFGHFCVYDNTVTWKILFFSIRTSTITTIIYVQ